MNRKKAQRCPNCRRPVWVFREFPHLALCPGVNAHDAQHHKSWLRKLRMAQRFDAGESIRTICATTRRANRSRNMAPLKPLTVTQYIEDARRHFRWLLKNSKRLRRPMVLSIDHWDCHERYFVDRYSCAPDERPMRRRTGT